jgi:uncharacterized membrane protein YeaQ/YmgE (transglycosylase-associated protein family)
MEETITLIIVLCSAMISTVVPTWLASHRLLPRSEWFEVFFAAWVLGLVSQSVFGLLWNHLVSRDAGIEVIFYYFFWLIISVILLVLPRRSPSHKRESDQKINEKILLGILCVAVVVRSIHPLRHFALGQSDAYSHLHFLKDVINIGYLQNAIYPPGYHWVLALPTLTFQLDPFNVVRYVGAFFGAGLVLAVFVIVKGAFNDTSAFLSAFFAACFPGFYLLQKTGVGAFANQLGLFFIPAILYFYLRMIENEFRWSSYSFLFIVSLMGFIVSVPMMMIHVCLIIMLERIFALLKRPSGWVSRSMIVVVSGIPALLLFLFHLLHPVKLTQTEAVMVFVEDQIRLTADAAVTIHRTFISDWLNHPGMKMIIDFISIKRWGFGNALLDLIGYLFVIFFMVIFYHSVKKGKPFLTIMSMWGTLTTVQSLTGFLQFSAYQREGWSLLIVIACLSGIVGAHIYRWGIDRWKIMRPLLYLFLVISSVWSIFFPPGHLMLNSWAEDDIIQIVRNLSSPAIHQDPLEKRYDHRDKDSMVIRNALSEFLPVTIIARNFSGWWTGQGEMINVVMHHPAAVENEVITEQTSLNLVFKKNRQYVVFLDAQKTLKVEHLGMMARLNRDSAEKFVNVQKDFFRINQKIRDALKVLSPGIWNTQWIELNDRLTVVVVKPRQSKVEQTPVE